MEEVRRAGDGELCGFVERRAGGWRATTVFAAPLGDHDGRDEAVAQVLSEGLASLSERWVLRRPDGSEEPVCICEADTTAVTVALGYYSLPGVPTLRVTADQLAAGEYALRRR